MRTILLVDDGDARRLTTKWLLSSFGYAVESTRNAEEALALFDPKIHDAVVAASALSGMTGTELAHIIKLRSPSTPMLMYPGATISQDPPCVDATLPSSAHLLILAERLEQLLATRA
jgi:CheY-like chemotaxis protein